MEAVIRGRLGADPEVRTLGEKTVARFRIALDGPDEHPTVWIDAEIWGQAAARAKTLAKGAPILGVGTWRASEWQDQEGKTRRSQFVALRGIGPDLSRCEITAKTPAKKAEENPYIAAAPSSPSSSTSDPFDEE